MRCGILSVILVAALAGDARAACVGDCSGDGEVTVDELIQGVNIALGTSPTGQCESFDVNADGEVTINELITGVNGALLGCTLEVAGDYSGEITFGTRHGSLRLSANDQGQIGGALIVASAATLARAAQGLTFPVGSVTITLIGTVNTGNGTFQVSGTFTDGNGQTTTMSVSGVLPSASGATSISALVNGETFAGTLSTGTPTPAPTATGPTPTPVASCGDGSFTLSFSNASADSNVNTQTIGFGKINAVDSKVGSFFTWAVAGQACGQPVYGEVVRAFEIAGSDAMTTISPGTYPITLATPPFIRVNYKETQFILGDPTHTWAHAWVGSQGTLEVTDAGGGALHVHAVATMAPNPITAAAIGTFTVEISGTLTNVKHR